MGEVFRRYWIPALLSEELPDADGAPVRVRLLGEDLIAFRDSEGKVGLLAEACPHRGTSLALALNADCGLRCIFHGYKFDVNGTCVDTPTEPEGSRFAQKIRADAYPVREAAGMIWAYLGPTDLRPNFPEFEWFGLPASHQHAYKVFEECNYAQAVEGAIDSAHAGVLHRRSTWDAPPSQAFEEDLSPKLEVEYTQYGMRYGALRNVDAGQASQARITAVVLPCFTFIPPFITGPKIERRLVNAYVPRDDTSTWNFQVLFSREASFDDAHRRVEGGLQLDADYKKLRNLANNYEQDRSAMKSSNFSGITGILVQDHAVSETQGSICDRTREHLGTSDIAVIAWRRLMLRTSKQLAETGEQPPGVHTEIPFGDICSATIEVPPDTTWREVEPLAPALAR
jgi:phenylpropionate dioxygenase-like ring-hydroxylating dioxygenase large terminal subunit